MKRKIKKLIIVPTKRGIRVYHPEQYYKAVVVACAAKSQLRVVSI